MKVLLIHLLLVVVTIIKPIFADNDMSIPKQAKIFAVPNAQINAVEIDGEKKRLFKIGAARDGIQKAILDEVKPSVVTEDISENFNDDNQIFGAYDEEIVEPVKEIPIFIPKMYRSDKDEPSTTTTTTTTPEPTTTTTMRSTTTRRLTTAFVPRTSAPRQTSQPRTVVTNRNSQIISSNTETQFVRNNVRPQQLINSGHVQTVQRPQTTQAPRIIAPLTTRTAFVPQQQQSRFQPGFHQPRPVLQTRTGFSNPPPRTRPTAPPTRFPVTRATTQKPRNIQSFTPRQQNRPQPNTGNLRTGVCRASIFYLTSVPNQHDTNQQFTHFALVVSVDQCARTCHEFNCAVAIFDSNTKHCQFIPATSFSIREGQCPNWPNPLFRNNALGTNSIRISCVTCQRRRRNFQRVRGMSRGFRGSRPQPATLQTTRFLPQTINRSAITNIRLNGVVLKQSTSKAISTAELESRQISDNVNSQLQKS